MRHIGTISDGQQAEKFSAYLMVKGIANQIEPDGDAFDVWVKDEDQLDKAIAELTAFESEPGHPRYEQSVELARTIKKDQEEKRAKAAKNVVHVREGFSQTGVKHNAPLTKLLVFLAIAVTIFGGTSLTFTAKTLDNPVFTAMTFNSMDGSSAQKVLEARDGDDDNIQFRLASILKGEAWRTITPIFIHFGLIHLAFNGFMLFRLGGMLEHRYGTTFMGGLVLLTAIIPNILQGIIPESLDGSVPLYAVEGAWIRANFGGLSGVLYGVFGFLWIRGALDPRADRLPNSTIVILIIWMFLGMFHVLESVGMGSIANWAHGGGLVVGAVLAYLYTLVRNPNS